MWIWQQQDWPKFRYDEKAIRMLEDTYLHQSGLFQGTLRHLSQENKTELIIDLISDEALKTSEIEGEFLNRDSLQSLIRKHFGLHSEQIGKPTLIALSTIIQNKKKAYYDALAASNRNMEITPWVVYFSQTILDAQLYTQNLVNFIIEKTKFYDRIKGKLNDRQKKVIARIFREGPEGFKGGLSAENYIRITGTSRATATRDLQNLLENGVLAREGELKSTRYYLRIGSRG